MSTRSLLSCLVKRQALFPPSTQWLAKQYRSSAASVPNKNDVWRPKKRLSREAMERLRSFAAMNPEYTTVDVATEFKISPEAVRRILKSKFKPTESVAKRQEEKRYKAMGDRKKALQAGFGNKKT